jgi:hypothetical protein
VFPFVTMRVGLPEAVMNLFDERLKCAFAATLARAGIDTSQLSIEVKAGTVTITGTVPTFGQRRRLWSLLITTDTRARDIDCGVGVLAPPVEASISLARGLHGARSDAGFAGKQT